MPFDPESGQMYDEILKSLPKKDEDDLVYVVKPGHIRERPKNHLSTKGTRTLYKMAMLAILRSLDLLYSDLLKAIPIPILEQIWKSIKDSHLDGLRMWKLFAPILISQGDAQLMARRVDKRLQNSFAHAINQISSSNCSWLAELTLDGIPLTTAEYVQVSEMRNLRTLAVVARPSKDTGFSDRVLRAWSADAKNDSFGNLQYMLVSGHGFLTEQSLAYLNNFRALALFCAHNCRFGMCFSRNAEDNISSLHTPLGWHDPRHGLFRSFLKAKSAIISRADCNAPFPSSFHAYMAQCRRTKDSQLSRVPHLLITLLPEDKQDARAVFSRRRTLHCFERKRDAEPSAQTAKANDTPHKKKRRKLRDGKSKAVGDMLDGLM